MIVHTVVSIEDSSAGPTYSVTGLARAQSQFREEVSVWSTDGSIGKSDEDFLDRRFKNNFESIPGLGRLSISTSLRTALHFESPSIVHTHGLWRAPNTYLSPAAPFVISPRGMLNPSALKFSPLKKQLARSFFQDRALNSASLFHATADTEYDDIRRFGQRQPVAVIPNGIELPPIASTHNSRNTVLSLGRIHPQKALDSLIVAWADIELRFPDWKLKIVGPDAGGHAAELSNLVHNLGLTNVTIEPPVFGDDKAALMAGVDLFVLPSQSENFAMTVAESLASGVPVISTKGAPWSGLNLERCGWWVDHGHNSLAKSLHTALSLPEPERRAMGARGRDWMARDFSWDCIARETLRVYDWLLDRGDMPECVRLD